MGLTRDRAAFHSDNRLVEIAMNNREKMGQSDKDGENGAANDGTGRNVCVTSSRSELAAVYCGLSVKKKRPQVNIIALLPFEFITSVVKHTKHRST